MKTKSDQKIDGLKANFTKRIPTKNIIYKKKLHIIS